MGWQESRATKMNNWHTSMANKLTQIAKRCALHLTVVKVHLHVMLVSVPSCNSLSSISILCAVLDFPGHCIFQMQDSSHSTSIMKVSCPEIDHSAGSCLPTFRPIYYFNMQVSCLHGIRCRQLLWSIANWGTPTM